MAYKAGMDIINLSLGIHGGWEEQAFAEIVSRIVSKGVHGNHHAIFKLEAYTSI